MLLLALVSVQGPATAPDLIIVQQYFLSYSRRDTDAALRLVNDLRDADINVWVDQLELPAGKHWDRGIEHALAASIGLLLLLSPHSVL